MKKTVIRAPNWLGDITMSLPFFLALPEAVKDSEIHVIVKPEYEGLFSHLPYKVHTHTFSKKTSPGLKGILDFCRSFPVKSPDVYITLAPSFSSALMGFLLKASKRIGFVGEARSLFLTDAMKWPKKVHRADEFLKLLNPLQAGRDGRKLHTMELAPYFEDDPQKNYIVINVNSEASSRRMPIYQWEKLLNQYKGQTFVFVGAEKEREWVSQVAAVVQKDNEVINIAGKSNIMELARIMAFAKLVITNDSGPAHLAAYVGAPVLTWIGAADAVNTVMLAKDESKVNVFSIELPCSPCLKNSCPLNTIDCLTKIEMDDVYKKSLRYLD